MNQPVIIKGQPVSQISPIDPKQIVEHGESTTSIILAITILLSISVSGLTGLIYVILATRSTR
jgi:hypothetical protein